ncbi:polysaccharide biosynthesis/export family protein [Haloferula sp.]|uniref:polysaccharide biosynthesis/export family protein n=1 Tax=Haloferula sp. TaxID=2497595 RepID=UPI00329C623C
MMDTVITRWMVAFLIFMGMGATAETLRPGDAIRVTLRGVTADEQQRINGEYTVGDDGRVSLPMLDGLVRATGLTPSGFARVVEKSYKDGGIYAFPAIDVVALKEQKAAGAVISVGGHVKRAGQVPFRQGMTVIQALDAAGGRDPYAGRNILLLRGGKQYCIDFKKLAHKSIVLRANDSLQMEMKAALIDRWKGKDEEVKSLIGN